MDNDAHLEWPHRVIEPEANPTDDFSESMRHSMNFYLLVCMYIGCCMIVTGVWLL